MFGLVIILLLGLAYIYIESLVKNEHSLNLVNSQWYPGIVTTIRLFPGDDLKKSLLSFADVHKLSSGSILSCVGSVQRINLRLASASALSPSDYLVDEGKHEIVSLVGTMEYNTVERSSYGHFHASFADRTGNVVGGHLMDGCTVFTTAEIVILQIPRQQYTRVLDPISGYKELKVTGETELYVKKILCALRNDFAIGFQYLACRLAPTWLPTETCPAVY